MTKTRIALVLIACLFLAVLPLAAQDKAPAKKPMAMCEKNMAMKMDMKAVHDKIMSTWKDAQKATTPEAKETALKAHGEALAEMEAAHQKMAAGEQDMMKMCKEKMAAHKEKKAGCACCDHGDMGQ